MNGYSNLSSSSPPMAERANGGVVVPSIDTKEAKNPWEGVVVGGVTLTRNFSSASQRFRAKERSKNYSHGLQAVVRRAFSMRRQPSNLAEGYWRIHDMDGEGGHEEPFEEDEEVKEGEEEPQRKQQQQMDATSKKKMSKILKACKKLLGFEAPSRKRA